MPKESPRPRDRSPEGGERVLLFKGPSLYDGTRTFIDELAAAFRRRGFTAEVGDLRDVTDVEAAIAAFAGPPTLLVFSINILGEHRDGAGRTIAEIFKAPHVVWYVDYALSLASRIRETPPSASLLVVDPTQVEAVQSIFGRDRFASVAFMPHAAVGDPSPEETLEQFAGRDITVLWCGTYVEPGEPAWRDQPPAARKIYDDALDLALSVEWMPPLAALDAALAASGVDPSDPRLGGARCDARVVDLRVRRLRRQALIDRLAASGLPMTICGEGWAAQHDRFGNAAFPGSVPMMEAVGLMRRARVVLNTNANFGAGSHERPLTALLAGAAAWSDYSAFFASEFEAEREIALFRWSDLDAAMDQLARLAGEPAAAFELAQGGKRRVLRGHRWDHRIDTILGAAAAGRSRL